MQLLYFEYLREMLQTCLGVGVIVRPWKAGNYPKIGNWSFFVIVWMASRIRDNHEMGRARALPFRCHHDSGK